MLHLLSSLPALAGLGPAAPPPQAPPVELGRVVWLHDHEEAFAAAARRGKPVLILFQEVPG